ncbi:MAG: ROK family protein [Eubacteriales bacterium]
MYKKVVIESESASKHSAIRRKNLRLILDLYRKNNFSTYQISKQLNLSSGGAKKLVDDIVEGGILTRTVAQREGIHGRYPITYGINPNYGFIAIINFATKELLSLSLNGNLLENVKLDIGENISDENIYKIGEITQSLADKWLKRNIPLLAIAIAYIGKLHTVTYEKYMSGIFKNCSINLYQYFKEKFEVDVILQNDLHFAILAEQKYGILTGKELSCCYLQIGRGCAASYLIDNKLYVGATGLAGEIGHNCVLGSNKVVENFVDWISVQAKIQEKTGKQLQLETAVGYYNSGDSAVCSVVDEAAQYAGVIIKNLTELMDFDIIILSGPMTEFGARYMENLKKSFYQYGNFYVQIVRSALGEESIGMGAFEMARDVIFDKFIESRLSGNDFE